MIGDALVSVVVVFGKIKQIFGSGHEERGFGTSGLGVEGIEKIGTPEDPLHGYEEALERNFSAMEAEKGGEVDRATELYERSVAEEFVGSHPYERLANLCEQRRNYGEALRVLEAYVLLSRSGRMPRGGSEVGGSAVAGDRGSCGPLPGADGGDGIVSVNVAGRMSGALTVIVGLMFAGKTEELIRLVRRALYARRSVQVFKPALDTRSEMTEIRSHDGALYEALAVSTSKGILPKVEVSTDVVAIEEAQFFDEGIVEVCGVLADQGCEVIVTGLDMDFRGQPFGPMPALLAVADEVVKLRAICARCGRDASRSQRLIDGVPAPISAPTIQVGSEESYEARCRHCHEVLGSGCRMLTPGVN